MKGHDGRRRTLLAQATGVALAWQAGAVRAQAASPHPDRKWYEAAAAMKRLAESWGDQPYGAVLVLGGRLAGEGPSRVVKNQDNSAHAEREAIRDAQRRLGRQHLTGAVLYSTSRPCALCEAAAVQARVSRVYHGASMDEMSLGRLRHDEDQHR